MCVVVTRSTSSIFSPGLILQGRYRLDEPVAAGGMAEIWRGQDMVLQRQVAMKLLHPHLASDPQVAERFKREAVAAARLSHPHVVPTFDAGTDRGVSYIVLGLVSGPTLADLMAEGKLGPQQAAEIARQVADALEHAHRQGLIHRDIKPANVLMVDGGRRVMVADFGIAKAVAETASESLTMPGLIVGTPGYVAPEQMNGSSVDARSDIYALGVMLHEMVCGHTDSVSPTVTLPVDAAGDAPQVCQEIPAPISEVVARAIARDPNARYATAGEMRDDLIRCEVQMRSAMGEYGARLRTTAPPAPLPQGQIKVAEPQTTGLSPDAPFGGKWNPVPAQKAARRRHWLTAIVLAVLVAAAIALGLGFKHLTHQQPSGIAANVNQNSALALSGASSFDPLGDNTENDSQAINITDGNPETTWSTSTYSNSHFGNLKDGVGVIVHLSQPSQIKSLQVASPSTGWSATIYAADSSPTSLNGWGPPVGAQNGISPGTTTFQLTNAHGSNVLIWITDLGGDNKVTISDVVVKG